MLFSETVAVYCENHTEQVQCVDLSRYSRQAVRLY
jgi:hypothetical protein